MRETEGEVSSQMGSEKSVFIMEEKFLPFGLETEPEKLFFWPGKRER